VSQLSACAGTSLTRCAQGVVVSLIQLFATLAAQAEARSAVALGHKVPDARLEARDSAVVFFTWSAVFMLLSLVVIVLLSRSALYRAVSARQARARELVSPAGAPLSVGSDPRTAGWEEGKGFGRYIPHSMRDGAARIRSVQSQVIAMSVCIAWCFIVTIAVFPSLSSRVRPWPTATPPEDEPRWRDPLVFVALHYVLFNAGDLVGRMLPTLLPRLFLLEARRAIIFWSGMREGFLGLLPLCNVSHAAADTPGRRAVVAAVAVAATAGRAARFGDATFFALMVLLGLSNGVLSTSIFISGPKRPGVKEDERP
jgi:equilibrative nucleoside transporter 1/2/3